MYLPHPAAGAESARLPRLAADPGGGGATHEVVFAPDLARALMARAGALRAPVGALLLAAHVGTLAYVCGSTDVLTGVQGIGTWPLRVRLDDDGSWIDLIDAVVAARTAADPDGRPGPVPEVETAFGYRDEAFPAAAPPDCPLWADVVRGRQLRLTLRYRAAEFTAEQVGRFGGYYLRALEQLASNPAARRAPLLGADEEDLLRGFAGPEVPLPEGTFVDLFDRQARAHPHRVALRCDGGELTYAALDGRSEGVATFLARAGIGPADVVTTLLPRGQAWAVTVLAVLKLGAVYLPQDLDHPVSRITAVLRRSRCGHVVTDAASAPRLRAELGGKTILVYEEAAGPAGLAGAAPAVSTVPRPGRDDPAYLIFTSGSTGEPKGAIIRHSGMLNHLVAKERDLRLGADDRIAQIATQCFDISVWQLLVAWMRGAATTIYGRYDVLDVPGFLRALAADGITILEVVPSYLDLILSQAERLPVGLPSLRFNLVTGERLPPDLTARWFARYPTVPLVNAYGPTEASDDVTHHVMDGPAVGARVPVGRPIINTGIYVVGPDDTLRPLGSFGEICVTGVGVGAGYVHDEERTAAVFRPNTLDGRSPLLYRTGDIGRWLPGGILDCAGRTDDQVKVRGYRIELSDVDAALVRLPGVEAAVTVIGTDTGQPRLVSYFVGSAGADLTSFQRGLAAVLPAYMHPEKVVQLDRLPLTARGKVDRQALVHRHETPTPGTA